jgi:hypothetical protein
MPSKGSASPGKSVTPELSSIKFFYAVIADSNFYGFPSSLIKTS